MRSTQSTQIVSNANDALSLDAFRSHLIDLLQESKNSTSLLTHMEQYKDRFFALLDPTNAEEIQYNDIYNQYYFTAKLKAKLDSLYSLEKQRNDANNFAATFIVRGACSYAAPKTDKKIQEQKESHISYLDKNVSEIKEEVILVILQNETLYDLALKTKNEELFNKIHSIDISRIKDQTQLKLFCQKARIGLISFSPKLSHEQIDMLTYDFNKDLPTNWYIPESNLLLLFKSFPDKVIRYLEEREQYYTNQFLQGNNTIAHINAIRKLARTVLKSLHNGEYKHLNPNLSDIHSLVDIGIYKEKNIDLSNDDQLKTNPIVLKDIETYFYSYIAKNATTNALEFIFSYDTIVDALTKNGTDIKTLENALAYNPNVKGTNNTLGKLYFKNQILLQLFLTQEKYDVPGILPKGFWAGAKAGIATASIFEFLKNGLKVIHPENWFSSSDVGSKILSLGTATSAAIAIHLTGFFGISMAFAAFLAPLAIGAVMGGILGAATCGVANGLWGIIKEAWRKVTFQPNPDTTCQQTLESGLQHVDIKWLATQLKDTNVATHLAGMLFKLEAAGKSPENIPDNINNLIQSLKNKVYWDKQENFIVRGIANLLSAVSAIVYYLTWLITFSIYTPPHFEGPISATRAYENNLQLALNSKKSGLSSPAMLQGIFPAQADAHAASIVQVGNGSSSANRMPVPTPSATPQASNDYQPPTFR